MGKCLCKHKKYYRIVTINALWRQIIQNIIYLKLLHSQKDLEPSTNHNCRILTAENGKNKKHANRHHFK